MKILATVLCSATLLCAANPNTDKPLRELLISALMGNEALETIRAIAKLPKARLDREGVSVVDNKQGGYDEVIRVRLKSPLIWNGATTTQVTLAFETPYADFNALVFAKFSGDIKTFAKLLDLKKGKPKETTPVGVYNRALSDGSGCPVTLGATPIDPKTFVFGCGWCNGG